MWTFSFQARSLICGSKVFRPVECTDYPAAFIGCGGINKGGLFETDTRDSYINIIEEGSCETDDTGRN